MAIIWNAETMSTGFDDIDEQHKELFERLNALLDAMKDGKGKSEIERLLGFLGDYAVRHFAHEEDCMARHRCPMASANKEAHAKFIRTFEDLSRRLVAEGPSLALVIETQQKVADWIQSHIVRVDTHLRGCALSRAGAAV
jgi:hemerythrin